MVQAHLTGAFPRSERLVEVTRASDRGKATREDLNQAIADDLKALMELQREAGLDLVVDGQLNWQDLFRPFSELFTGIQLGSLTRWFDNNTFYRKPIVVDKVRFQNTDISAYFRCTSLPSEAAKKAILPGPFTFAVMSQNVAYQSLPELVNDIAHALKDTVTVLRRAGYTYFQFNEPMLCVTAVGKSELEIAKNGLEVCASDVSLHLHTYFGDAGPVIEDLLDFPAGTIGLDLYSTSIGSIREYDFDKGLGCGCIDARNSLLEAPQDLARLVAKIRQDVEPKDVFICPNCDLEFLPYSVAEKKVRILSETKRMVL